MPAINFEADGYHKMINLSDFSITFEPRLLKYLSAQGIVGMLEKSFCLDCADIRKIPCDTYAVERAIKDVTEASQHVYGGERRDAWSLKAKQAACKTKTFEI